MNNQIKEKIIRRRKQMIVHSIIYYRFGMSIISDAQFDKWGKELVQLQKNYPKESECSYLFDNFEDWDGTTGYHLSTKYEYVDVAYRLIQFKNKQCKQKKNLN